MNKKFDPNILTIVDVGALGGLNQKWHTVPHNAVLFDPNPKAVFQEKDRELVIQSALFESQGTKDLYLTRKSSNSSLYEPNLTLINKFSNPERFDVIQKISLAVQTLDAELHTNNVDDVDYIKLDVQGAELSILKGANETLGKAVALEVEVEFAPIYKNQPLFGELDAYLKSKGFELVSFLHLETWKFDRCEELIWGDAFYVKNLESLGAEKRQRLSVIKEIVLSKKKKPVFNLRKLIKNIKSKLKNVLMSWQLLHPSGGAKISQREKAALIVQHKTPELAVLVETGTRDGWMLKEIGHLFERVYSVEIDEKLYQEAVALFAGQKKFKLFHGDSAVEIKKILSELDKPALFWLDAHGDGVISKDNSPLLAELEAIFSHRIKNHTILIDDVRHIDRQMIKIMKKMVIEAGYTFGIGNGIFRIYGR